LLEAAGGDLCSKDRLKQRGNLLFSESSDVAGIYNEKTTGPTFRYLTIPMEGSRTTVGRRLVSVSLALVGILRFLQTRSEAVSAWLSVVLMKTFASFHTGAHPSQGAAGGDIYR
jgi:hypothetical protein